MAEIYPHDFTKTCKNMNTSNIEKQSENLLDIPISAAFLEAKEYLSYYWACHSIDTARDIYDDILYVLNRFIELVAVPDSLAKLDDLFYGKVRVRTSNPSEWTTLLGLSPPFTFDDLKRQYRKADEVSSRPLVRKHGAHAKSQRSLHRPP